MVDMVKNRRMHLGKEHHLGNPNPLLKIKNSVTMPAKDLDGLLESEKIP
jgi:hypothetical protein